nr:hypothetical protein [Deltaproteobacteria bacterium]
MSGAPAATAVLAAFALLPFTGCQHGTAVGDLADLGAKELRVEASETIRSDGTFVLTASLARASESGIDLGTIDCPALRDDMVMNLDGIVMETVTLGGEKPAHLKGAELGEACMDPSFHIVLIREQTAGMTDLRLQIADSSAEISMVAEGYFLPVTITPRGGVTTVSAGAELALDVSPSTHTATDNLLPSLAYRDQNASYAYGTGSARVSAESSVGSIRARFPAGIPMGAADLHLTSIMIPSTDCQGVDSCSVFRRLDQTVSLTITP